MKAKFLEFVDASRAPNGRRVGSSSPVYYFDAMFSSFRVPDKNMRRRYDVLLWAASTWHKRVLCLLVCHCAVCIAGLL